MAQHEEQTAGATNFKFHLAWNRALFLLDAGKTDEVLEAYERKVRDFSSPLFVAQPDLYIDVQNAASLLLRLELPVVAPDPARERALGLWYRQ